MTNQKFRRDNLWIRHEDQLIAGSPARFFRLTSAGKDAAKALESEAQPAVGHGLLTSRLVGAGALHPFLEDPIDPALITVVIPAHIVTTADLQRLQDLVDALKEMSVIVVDDASPTPVHVRNATVTALTQNSGPGLARNRGLELVTTPYVAFIDSDVQIESTQICILAAQLGVDAKVVAPRVIASKRRSILARYERNTAPLDMGRHAARVTHGSRVSYVPSAVLVCDTSTVRDAGGFDHTLRCGEDVDFVWRLIDEGNIVRYEPSVTCTHDTRRGLIPFLTQRFNYGSSAIDLDKRHEGRLTPLRARPTTVASWLCFGLGWHLVALAFALLDAAHLAMQFERQNISRRLMLAMFVKNFLNTGVHLADAVVKVWWPVVVVLATLFESVSGLLALCIAVPGLVTYFRRPTLDPFSFLFLRTLEKFSYGAGAWVKGFSVRNLNALRPHFLPMSNSSVSG